MKNSFPLPLVRLILTIDEQQHRIMALEKENLIHSISGVKVAL